MTDPAADLRTHTPRDPAWEEKVRTSFARQPAMTLIRARLARVAPGEAEVAVDAHAELTQQHGYFHAGTTASIADSAAGYAALSLFEPGTGVLTTEFKINLLAPARGEYLIARGRVVKPGRTLTVCRSDVHGVEGARETHVATALLTMMQVPGLAD